MASYNVTLHNAQASLPQINETAAATFAQATILEDIGIQPVNHAYNPLTGRGFLRQQGFGGSAYLYVDNLLEDLNTLCGQTNFADSDLYEAWTLTGRIFHVLQDMASPLHVFSVWHVLKGCHFEIYWYPLTEEALQLVNVWDVEPTSLPHLPAAALQGLDTQSRSALEKRITALPNTLAAYQDALAWCAYYRASFWGEIRYAEEASTAQTTATRFDDQETEALPNTLAYMFGDNIRYHPRGGTTPLKSPTARATASSGTACSRWTTGGPVLIHASNASPTATLRPLLFWTTAIGLSVLRAASISHTKAIKLLTAIHTPIQMGAQ
jgi:hypothetical protein